ncbi:YdiU family protein [Bowmanella sp. JS7-9]|uniref:Protein nucleotidyltransferase YdiU n=1 Tax=Pseudobowmanella zhangzhouensis TaxID=1537679 RepID=A0ABW1XMV8_9ALTE|nr:YdiU family protein [Bowmanella sp. JS7-9]TBX23712.1 hypothetical protein TK45_06345 [Bowmanella sp. JS7-9]
MKFFNSYQELGEEFAVAAQPVPVAEPTLLLLNRPLMANLAIDASEQQLAQILSGNQLHPSSKPVAMAYSGHQFGHFNPYLGDGRAHLLGELQDTQGKHWDLHLKGSGRTPFSRNGDGRCGIGPALREYIMSEAMYHLGVPTTRTLAVCTTGERVFRQLSVPGGVVARVASSHIRVGTFQYFAARDNLPALNKLLDYSIARHYPHIDSQAPDAALQFLDAVMQRQISLMVHWMRVGFIHGVMNTDNCAISGETIDFGPCAMLSIYRPDAVFSSIDRDGRYAFNNQAGIGKWNMARLAEALLPLIDQNQQQAVDKVMPILDSFDQHYTRQYQQMMANKIGLRDIHSEQDAALIGELLALMETLKLDYTHTFSQLGESLTNETVCSSLKASLGQWVERWLARVSADEQAQQLMATTNPVVIPRNHHVERLLSHYEQHAGLADMQDFLQVLSQPYQQSALTGRYQDVPENGDVGYRTFCGT